MDGRAVPCVGFAMRRARCLPAMPCQPVGTGQIRGGMRWAGVAEAVVGMNVGVWDLEFPLFGGRTGSTGIHSGLVVVGGWLLFPGEGHASGSF